MAESSLIRNLYDSSPPFFQNVMASVFGLQKNWHRFSHPKWKHWLEFYQQSDNWSPEEMETYRWNELKSTLKHAEQTVPFYRQRFADLGISVDDIRTVDDLQQLPYTTKDDIRAHSEDMISEAFDPRTLNMDPTSGSTGQPLRLYNDREATIRNYAIRWARCRPGLTRRMKSANFTGLEIVHPSQASPPFWRTNYASRQQLYSVFHMHDDTLSTYVEELNRFKPEWIYGYPSALFTLAEFMIRSNLKINPVRAVVTSSESCLPHYRDAIERAFGATLWDEYGQAEFAGLAFQCECGKLHELMDYSFLEFNATGEREDGFDVCELICTSIINPCWPLIRYQVGDLALINPKATCPLGKPGRIIERLHGRTSQFLLTNDGRKIANISVMAKKCRNMKSCQAIQDTPGEMTLRIVPEPEFISDDAVHAVGEFRKKLGDEEKMKIRVEVTDQPLLTSAGKFLMIVSRLPKQQLHGTAT